MTYLRQAMTSYKVCNAIQKHIAAWYVWVDQGTAFHRIAIQCTTGIGHSRYMSVMSLHLRLSACDAGMSGYGCVRWLHQCLENFR